MSVLIEYQEEIINLPPEQHSDYRDIAQRIARNLERHDTNLIRKRQKRLLHQMIFCHDLMSIPNCA